MAATAARSVFTGPPPSSDAWPAVRVPAAAGSLDGFRAWAKSDQFPQRGCVSFINGEILIDRSPEDLNTHSRIKAEIGCRIHQLVEELDLGEFYPDRTLLSNPAAGLSTEPEPQRLAPLARVRT